LGDILSNINNGLSDTNIDSIHISVDVIAKCISKLKSAKSDGGQGFDSDHLLKAALNARIYIIIDIIQ
jgi:hypothetical protein